MRHEELELIRRRLGRELTRAEHAFFESHWSEHCSYKSTRHWLRLLPSRAPWVVRGPGFDAPLVDVGGGILVTFKIESHNHPSAIDPYNGAATGVGGIIRDILTVGAKPIGLLVNLHFGPPEDPHARWIARGVVRGISDYGNRVGVPVVGGETWFDESFSRNPIVLATCIGIVRRDEVPPGNAEPGDLIVVAGSPTDRSGLGGSAFASRGLRASREDEEADLGAVQVADPLMGKLLIDVVQEVRGCVKIIKDLGGGGLATALAELAEYTGLGVEADLSLLHLADESMGPHEVLASETQERMVFVTNNENLECLMNVLRKYEVPYSVIGRFVERPGVRVYWHGSAVVDVPQDLLRAPEITWPMNEPERPRSLDVPELPMGKTIEAVLSSPNIASKEEIYTQFDFDVGVRTVLKPGEGDAAVLEIFEAEPLGIAVKGDANPRYSYLDPFLGAMNAFVKAYRNVAAVGARPLAAVDSINVGSPEEPDRYWQFVESVRGLARAAGELGVPIVGGKVSLYNEVSGLNVAIKPVVAVVVLGVINDVAHARRAVWRDGDVIRLVGFTRAELGGSEYVWRVFRVVAGTPPAIDFDWEKKLASLLIESSHRAHGIHDVGLGGLVVALAKMAVNSRLGADVDLCRAPSDTNRVDIIAYSESNGRAIITGDRDAALPGVVVGEAGGDEFVLRCGGNLLYRAKVERLMELMRLNI